MEGKHIKSWNDILVVRCPRMFHKSVWFTEKAQKDKTPYNYIRLTRPDGKFVEYDGCTKKHIKEFFGCGKSGGSIFHYDGVLDITSDVNIEDILLFQGFCKVNHIKFNQKMMEVIDYED